MPILHRDTDYAIRALASLAGRDEMASVTALAREIEVPADFLRKIMQALKRARLVESAQGPFGGYRLARPAGELTVLDVIRAVQGELAVNACFGEDGICANVRVCGLRRRLAVIQKELNSWFEGISLADIVQAVPRRKEIRA